MLGDIVVLSTATNPSCDRVAYFPIPSFKETDGILAFIVIVLLSLGRLFNDIVLYTVWLLSKLLVIWSIYANDWSRIIYYIYKIKK